MASTPPITEREGGLCSLGNTSSELIALDRQRRLMALIEGYFEEFRHPVYVYVFSICTQDAFLRLHVAMGRGEQIASVRSWVFRVAHNLAINEGKKRRFEVTNTIDGEESAPPSDLLPNPEERVLREERSARFRYGLSTLTDHQRQCMQLRAEGFQTQQIADILRISRSGVVDTLQRAMKRLRKVMV
jgi:RNA polymerase sigma factor (sigma-70 family)